MNKPLFVRIPVVELTREAYYSHRISEIEAETMGNSREKTEFENGHNWYSREDETRIEYTSVKIENICEIRTAWDKQYSILSHCAGLEYKEAVVPMSRKKLEKRIRKYINIVDISYE